jgi:glycosyltransferase involved in cell wall biosynthesis
LSRSAARAALGLPASGPIVGWVGRLTPEKGCDIFLEALGLLDRSGFHVSIVGSGPQRPELDAITRRLGLTSKLTWHGEIASAGRLLEAFDLLVMSSRTEGTPMVLFEAIQAGAGVVVTSVGGIPDVVSTDEALLVAPESPQHLADAISRALADPAATATRMARARARIDAEFSLQRWVEHYTLVYERVLSDRR